MGKWCRDKRSSGCGMCKPWKHGDHKYDTKEMQYRRRTDAEMKEAMEVYPPKHWYSR
jgi:hypothetical protein